MLLLSSSSLYWYWIHRVFSFAKKAWYDGLDIDLSKLNYDLWDKDYIKSLSVEFSLPVLSITAWIWPMDIQKVDKIMEIANFLDVQVVTFSPPHFWDKDIDWYRKYLPKLKKESHISISVQNVEPKFIFFIIPEYKNATLYEIKKLTWDTALDISSINTQSWVDILKAQKILWWSMKNIYFNDKKWTIKWIMPWFSWWWTSNLPLESFLMKLKTSWYNWFITLKVRPWELWAWNEDLVLQNLEYMKSYYKKHFLDFS